VTFWAGSALKFTVCTSYSFIAVTMMNLRAQTRKTSMMLFSEAVLRHIDLLNYDHSFIWLALTYGLKARSKRF
jgi:hypothetical protein